MLVAPVERHSLLRSTSCRGSAPMNRHPSAAERPFQNGRRAMPAHFPHLPVSSRRVSAASTGLRPDDEPNTDGLHQPLSPKTGLKTGRLGNTIGMLIRGTRQLPLEREYVMNVIIVGRRHGKRVIRWPQFFALGLGLALALGIGMGFVYSLLAGQWTTTPVLFGIVIGVSMAGLGLMTGLKCPIEKLKPLD